MYYCFEILGIYLKTDRLFRKGFDSVQQILGVYGKLEVAAAIGKTYSSNKRVVSV